MLWAIRCYVKVSPTDVSPNVFFMVMHPLYDTSLGLNVPWTNYVTRPLDNLSVIIHPSISVPMWLNPYRVVLLLGLGLGRPQVVEIRVAEGLFVPCARCCDNSSVTVREHIGQGAFIHWTYHSRNVSSRGWFKALVVQWTFHPARTKFRKHIRRGRSSS